MNYFTYAGVSSSTFGIHIKDKNVFSGPEFDKSFEEIPGKDGGVIESNKRWSNVKVSYKCFLKRNTIPELSLAMRQIKAWLGKEPDRYHELSDTYNAGYFRYAVINTDIDADVTENKIISFDVIFSCKPYLYSNEGKNKVTLTASGNITNPMAFNSKPYMKLYGSGAGKLTISNSSGNKTWNFSSISEYIEVDSEIMDFYKDGVLKNNTVSGNDYPVLEPGTNTITLQGITKAEITPRWRCL